MGVVGVGRNVGGEIFWEKRAKLVYEGTWIEYGGWGKGKGGWRKVEGGKGEAVKREDIRVDGSGLNGRGIRGWGVMGD